MLVMKFGGTSVQDSDALQRVLAIVASHAVRHDGIIVVLSATSKTTDALLHIARTAAHASAEDMQPLLHGVRDRHIAIATSLIAEAVLKESTIQHVHQLCDQLTDYCNGIATLGECTAQSLDMVASFGERLSTTIFEGACRAAGLHSTWFDVRTVMRTNEDFTHAVVDHAIVRIQCRATLLPMLTSPSIVVTQGFLGATADGRTTTLGRGGSDYTAAILGAACGAEEIQIWTDVSGVYTTDPRMVAEARPIPRMSFREVRELAIYGAKVLHPDTIAPAIDANIPVRVLNTFREHDAGTTITAEQPLDADLHAVSVIRSCVAIHTTQPTAFINDVEEHVLLRTSTAESTVLILPARTDSERVIIDVAVAGSTVHRSDVALIAVCGPRAQSASSVRTLAAVAQHALMIISGASEVTTFLVVADEHALETVRAIHGVLYSALSE
ncbi:lysine-sensitive aspartokinase 3 [soil metagenome]